MRRLGRSNGVSCRRPTWSPTYRYGALPCRFSQPTSGQPGPHNQVFSPGPGSSDWTSNSGSRHRPRSTMDEPASSKTDPERDQGLVPAEPGGQTGTLGPCRLRCDRSRSIGSSQRIRYPMITRQPPSGGASSTNYLIRLPNHPDHRPPPGAPAPGATRHRQQPYGAPKTPPSTIGPSR